MKTIIALVLFCYLTAALADVYNTFGTLFSSTNTASNVTLDFPILPSGQPLAFAAYSIGFNVSGPFSYVHVKDLYVTFSEDSIDHGIPHSLLSKLNITSSAQGTWGGYSDPCRFPVSLNQSINLHYNATTDSTDGLLTTTVGLVDVVSITNNQEMQIQCPLHTSTCTRFFYIDVVPPADDYIFNFTATRVSGDIANLTIAGEGNCPTAWSSNKGLHVEQRVDNNTPLVVNQQVSKTTRFWVQYYVPSDFAKSSTLKFSYSVSTVPQSPVATPSTEKSSGLPTWAYVLIAIGGVAVVGLLIFGVVKLSRKNKGGYTSV